MKPVILYEDNHVMVVNKPCNMPVQEDSSGDLDLLNYLKSYIKQKYNKPGNVYLGLVHRLDRPVSGLLVFAKTSKAASRLSLQVRNHSISKVYYAVVLSQPKGGRLVDYMIKDSRTFTSKIVGRDVDGAKQAVLDYNVVGTRDNLTLVRIELVTGRHHQIRLQFANAGYPLWGDARYNKSSKPGQQIALQSCELAFVHPTTKENKRFSIDFPDRNPWNVFER